jgi:hypothetical protein
MSLIAENVEKLTFPPVLFSVNKYFSPAVCRAQRQQNTEAASNGCPAAVG